MDAKYREELELLAIKLHDIDAVRFGDFLIKSGSYSPVYFDLSGITNHSDVNVRRIQLLIIIFGYIFMFNF